MRTERAASPSRPRESAPPPPLEVVIVTFGRSDLVTRCLGSVREFAPDGTLVHVVDNASPDDTVAVVARRFPDVDLVARTTNDGFAVANNVALERVTAPYVLVLNPDAELTDGAIDHLIAVLERMPDVGVLGCRLVQADGSPDHAAKRMIPSPGTALRYFALRLLGRTGSDYVAPQVGEREVGDVDAVNGAFMLVRTEAMRAVGTFDEAYWMYAEDLDWCLRFRESGWRVVYDGRVTARHLKGGTAGKARSLRLNYHFHRSMAIFYRRHMRSGNVVLDAGVGAGIWARFAVVSALDGARRAVRRIGTRRPVRRVPARGAA